MKFKKEVEQSPLSATQENMDLQSSNIIPVTFVINYSF